jgi:hypothetical protein
LLFLKIWQNQSQPGLLVIGHAHRWQREPSVVVVVHGDADLLQVIAALSAAGGFARSLNRRQEQRHQNANDGDDYQKLDQGESDSPRATAWPSMLDHIETANLHMDVIAIARAQKSAQTRACMPSQVVRYSSFRSD